MNNDRADVPVRSHVDVGPLPDSTTPDERDYSTLKTLQKDLHAELKELSSVSAFDLAEAELTVKEQVAAYRKAVQILQKSVDMVDRAVQDVERGQGGQQ